MPYRIALYMRVSKEDSREKEESSSIAAQRMLLQRYTEERFGSGHGLIAVTEYVDDGYTGMNLNRPAMHQLLEAVKDTAVDCIIVKDFSRFARDYIELGSYLEQIFPFMRIRFISVNDHYDSAVYMESMSGLDVNFRNLLYDLYSKDLSQKVRTALAARKEGGAYVSANAPFGYVKASGDRHMLLIEAEEAEIVRRIFDLAGKGYSSVQIAGRLNEEGVKTPLAFRRERGETKKEPKGGIYLWSASFISQMLRNPVYAGDIVYGKYEKMAAGDGIRLKSRREWQIIRNHHAAIVEREVWEMQNSERGKRAGKPVRHKYGYLLVGILICGGCGRNLRYRPGGSPYYYCCQCRKEKSRPCVDRVAAGELEAAVLLRLEQHLLAGGRLEFCIREYESRIQMQIQEEKQQLEQLERECSRQKRESMREYQQYAEGKRQIFANEKRRKEIGELEEKQRLLEKELSAHIAAEEKRRRDTGRNIRNQIWYQELLRELLPCYIRQITMQNQQQFEIEWEEAPAVTHLSDRRGD